MDCVTCRSRVFDTRMAMTMKAMTLTSDKVVLRFAPFSRLRRRFFSAMCFTVRPNKIKIYRVHASDIVSFERRFRNERRKTDCVVAEEKCKLVNLKSGG